MRLVKPHTVATMGNSWGLGFRIQGLRFSVWGQGSKGLGRRELKLIFGWRLRGRSRPAKNCPFNVKQHLGLKEP